MSKLVLSYVLGILSFIFSLTGAFSWIFSIPGSILAVLSFKDREKRLVIPMGYQGKLGKKKISARPFITTRYLSYIALVLNIFSIAVSLFATFTVITLFTIGAVTPKTIDDGQQGVERVQMLSEVREFRKAVEEGGRSTFQVSIAASPIASEPYYLLQVFEIFPDHQATFGWYRYDPKQKMLYKQNIAADTWEIVR